MTEQLRAQARTREGVVVSNAMDKTAVVSVKRRIRHKRYHKFIELSTRFMVHDERNECEVGDHVLICEARPMSRHKRWRLREVLQKGVREQPKGTE